MVAGEQLRQPTAHKCCRSRARAGVNLGDLGADARACERVAHLELGEAHRVEPLEHGRKHMSGHAAHVAESLPGAEERADA